jgi:hypothetical protein
MSFRPFSAVTLTVFRAGLALIMISSPVKGFLPRRALVAGFLTTLTFIRPGIENSLADFRDFLMIPLSWSNTAPTSFLVRDVLSAIWLMISDLVGGFALPTRAPTFFLLAICYSWLCVVVALLQGLLSRVCSVRPVLIGAPPAEPPFRLPRKWLSPCRTAAGT